MKKNLQSLFMIALLSISIGIGAKDYVIFSITQSLPMGHQDEILKKNYFVNLGKKQGVRKGTVLNVFRSITVQDPYHSKERYHHKVKLGEIEVLHVEDNSAIANLKEIDLAKGSPLVEIEALMIGDTVEVYVD